MFTKIIPNKKKIMYSTCMKPGMTQFFIAFTAPSTLKTPNFETFGGVSSTLGILSYFF